MSDTPHGINSAAPGRQFEGQYVQRGYCSTHVSDASEAYGFGWTEPNTREGRNGWNGLESVSAAVPILLDDIVMSGAEL